MRLLLHRGKKTLPLKILILTTLVQKNALDTPQGRWWRPCHLLVGALSFLVQYALRGIVSQQLCKTPQNSRALQQELLMLDNSLQAPIFETSDMSQLGTYLS